jgi:hypothetical protein
VEISKIVLTDSRCPIDAFTQVVSLHPWAPVRSEFRSGLEELVQLRVFPIHT